MHRASCHLPYGYAVFRCFGISARHKTGSYDKKQDITLSTVTTGAKIYYTTDGSDPKTNGIEYSGVITLAKDATVRAIAYYDGIYGEVSSFYYLFTAKDDFGVDAFYPSGVYEGSVNVTLTANNPENQIEYSSAVSYVYNFVPLAPIITLPSERYLKSDNN